MLTKAQEGRLEESQTSFYPHGRPTPRLPTLNLHQGMRAEMSSTLAAARQDKDTALSAFGRTGWPATGRSSTP